MKILWMSLWLILVGLNTFSQKGWASSSFSSIKIMTYNVENLFDTEDDPTHEDSTFLPLKMKANLKNHAQHCQTLKKTSWVQECLNLDWNSQTLSLKLSQIAKVIRSVDQGRGPDVILFQEIENERVLKQLRDQFLGELNYRTLIVLEGSDYRGIDLGVLSRLPAKSAPKLIPVQLSDPLKIRKDYRSVLWVALELPDKSILNFLNVHLPAPFHSYRAREAVLKKINEIGLSFPKHEGVVVGGDFNIPSSEESRKGLFRRLSQPYWAIAHQIGCEICPGTTYYPPKRSWSFFDTFLISKNLLETEKPTQKHFPWQISARSIQIHNPWAFQKEGKTGAPQSFKLTSKAKPTGVSDHFPMLMSLEFRRVPTAQK